MVAGRDFDFVESEKAAAPHAPVTVMGSDPLCVFSHFSSPPLPTRSTTRGITVLRS